ncbi:MAG TPA: NADPH-dependent F420 reductase [Bryobacteraceae bacterium]|nr:NADPH-dependent F420 reductase [Bryobacteraceae bacterium]
MEKRIKIAVLGAGNVGGALGRLWAGKGHFVTFGTPNPSSDKIVKLLSNIPGAQAATNRDAAASADAVALCVPWPAAQEAIQSAGDLAGKILIDATNPLANDLSGLVAGLTTSAAEQVASWAPGAKVVKAFNTIGSMNYGNARFGSQRADGFYCGDDQAAKAVVKQLIEDIDMEPVDVGPLRNARLIEPLAMLWIDLAVNQRQGTNHGFKLLRR